MSEEEKSTLLTGWVERTTKYTKAWSRRFVTFDTQTRKLSYGESEQKVKNTMLVTRIVRFAEQQPLSPNDKNLYVVAVEGTLEDSKAESWSFRFADRHNFITWYKSIRSALSIIGAMEPLDFGLPEVDPRSGLKFVDVPVEHLHRFSLLERAIVFFFGTVSLIAPGEPATPVPNHCFIIGDKYVYLFRANADVVRCFQITAITEVKMGENCLGLKVAGQADVAINNCKDVREVTSVLKTLYAAIKANEGTTLQEIPWTESFDGLCGTLNLTAPDGYQLQIVSPTPKARLKQALDAYQRNAQGQQSASGSPNPNQPAAPSASSAKKEESFGNVSIDDQLSQLLIKIGLPQYVKPLKKQHVDFDVVTCMEPADLVGFGVNDAEHRDMIIKAANGDLSIARSETVESLALDPSQGRPGGNVVVNLDSDTDDDLPPPPAAAQPQRVVIDLDSDSDDGLDLLPVSSGAAPAASAPAAIILPDDDDI